MQNRLDDIIDENKKIIFQPPPKENIPNIPTEDIYLDDNFTSLTKPETRIDIGKPNFDGDNITMIPNNDKAEIKKSLLQTTIDIKKKKNTRITPDYLQESIGKAASDLETVDYNNDTSIDDLETVDYNNDTTVADSLEPKLETIEEGDENKNLFEDVKFVKTVYNISDDENKHDKKKLEQEIKEVQFVKKVPAHPRLRLKRKVMLKNLQIKRDKEKNNPTVEWIRIIGNKNPKFEKEVEQPKFQEPNPYVQYIKTIKGQKNH